MGDDARMLGAIEDLVRRGRARGIGVTLITQRPAVLNKNVLTQIEVLVAMRLTSPQDRNALQDWVKYHADTESAEQMITSLPQLPIGTAWFWSPGWLDMFKKVAIRKRETFDSSSTPKVGQAAVKATKVAEVDLEDLKQQMAATIEKQEAEDPKLLRRRIVDLEKQLKAGKPEVQIKEVEVPVISDEQIQALTTATLQMQAASDDIIKALNANRPKHIPPAGYPPVTTEKPKTVTFPGKPGKSVLSYDPAKEGADYTEPNLRAGERRILETLARHAPMKVTRTQLGTLSRFKATGGTFGTYFGTLKRAGFLQDEGGEINITQAGLDYVGMDVPEPTTTEELLQMWQSALRAGERKMLDYLVDVYPNSVSREDLGTMTDFAHTGGTFGTYLGSLRRNGLIEESNGEIRASDTLFIGSRA
jgi:hypothetical protein